MLLAVSLGIANEFNRLSFCCNREALHNHRVRTPAPCDIGVPETTTDKLFREACCYVRGPKRHPKTVTHIVRRSGRGPGRTTSIQTQFASGDPGGDIRLGGQPRRSDVRVCRTSP